MAIWVCRTGLNGQYEKTFIENSCICLTREGFDFDLSKCEKSDVVNRITEINPEAARQTISNTWSQINIFTAKMDIGDIVIIPKKKSQYISVARVQGRYIYDGDKQFPLNHSRDIEFIAQNIDTTSFSQDIRYSMGAFRTVFGIRQEERFIEELRKMEVSVDEV